MKKFSVELASSILHLEMQKEQILKENNMVKRLCDCRMELFNNYINVCQLFFIRLTSQIIKFLDDHNKDKAISTTGLKKWYMNEMYDKLYTKKYTSNKMVLLFKLLQSKSDKDFFDDFENRFKNLIVSYNKNNENNENNFLEKFHELYSDILDWMETHILNILSFKISCDKINENILIDYTKYLDRCKINKHDDCQWSIPRCQSLDLVINEDIHIYISLMKF